MYRITDDLEKIISEIKGDAKAKIDIFYVDDDNLSRSTNNKLRLLLTRIDHTTIGVDAMFLLLGYLLCEAKDLLRHGQFGGFVNTYCRFSRRHANHCMIAYKVVNDYPTLKNLKLSLLTIIGGRNFPRKLKSLIADSVFGDIAMAKSDLLALQTAFINGEIGSNGKEFNKYIKKQKNVDVQKRWEEEAKRIVDSMNRDRKKLHAMREHHLQIFGSNSKNRIDHCHTTIDKILQKAAQELEETAKKWEEDVAITYKNKGTVLFANGKKGIVLGETLFNTYVWVLAKQNRIFWEIKTKDIDWLDTYEEVHDIPEPDNLKEIGYKSEPLLLTYKRLNRHLRDTSGNFSVREVFVAS